MENTGTVNMTVSTSLGHLMHQIAQEKITVDFNPRGASDIWDSCNIPATYWNDLLEMKKIAVTYERGGEVVDREDLSEEDLELYPDPVDWESWIKFKIEKFREDDDYFIEGLKRCYNGFEKRVVGDDIALTMNNIFKHYEAKDYEWIRDRSDDCADEGYEKGEGFCSLVAELPEVREKRLKFVKCAKWLCEQFGLPSARHELQRYEIEIRQFEKLHNAFCTENDSKLDDLLYTGSKLDMVAASLGTNLQQYLDALKEQDSYELAPADITQGWDAGFILPDGTVYAMNGPESSFIHVAIADCYFEENNLVEDPGYIGKDFQLMAQGWIKFNKQKILYDDCRELGKGWAKGITQRQKDVLCKYIDSTWNGLLYFGIHGKPVNKEELLNMTEEELDEVFS